MKLSTLRQSFLFGVLCLVMVGCAGGERAGNAITPALATPAPVVFPPTVVAGTLLPPDGTIYLGAYVNESGLPGGNTAASVGAFEASIGRKLAVDLQYQDFTAKFNNRLEQDDLTNGRVPIYSWNCGVPNAQITDGSYDDTLRLEADSLKAYGWPVFVRFFWDVNLPSTYFSRRSCYDSATDDPKNVFSPTEFIQAWRHIRQIFTQEGATNAVWLWSVNSAGTNAMSYYPGDDQVDWIGIDAYDLSGAGDFTATFVPFYTLLAPRGKPIMVSETGTSSPTQVSFFSQASSLLKTQFPQIRGFVYYDALVPQQDWRITPSALPSFAAFANDPYMGGYYVLH